MEKGEKNDEKIKSGGKPMINGIFLFYQYILIIFLFLNGVAKFA